MATAASSSLPGRRYDGIVSVFVKSVMALNEVLKCFVLQNSVALFAPKDSLGRWILYGDIVSRYTATAATCRSLW